MTTNPIAAYRTVDAMTADPVTLTTMLFDGAVKALRKAQLHWENGNRQGFNDETNRAYLIIGELRATLDMSQGELAEQLASIYAYCLRRIVEASLGDLEKVREVERLIGQIGDAWKTATAGLRAQQAASRAGTEAAA
ncbi:flagellar export chaperone FliS [Tepidiforma sp.]|uniref:flagellar export chaperone FliS n=1 Tax=Tepidiforma sp. TaxID=2682230 RepID=UPI002ADD9CEF|nr:flagellar export chaperone FliS [Tepidiforma sp.]